MPSTVGISSIHTDILESHVLTRLDGQTLASVSCTNATIHSLSERNHSLWSDVCHSTWPSTSSEAVSGIISTFSDNGARSFFSQAYPLPTPDPTTSMSSPQRPSLVTCSSSRLISTIDIYHKNKLIFTKTEETETESSWFKSSPFRIDLLDPKDMVPTEIPHPKEDATCTALMNELTLSWIIIDPVSKLAINISSHKPVNVQRHWLNDDVQVRFACILSGGNIGNKKCSDMTTLVNCGIVVNCGRSEGGEMHVREISMKVEDMDGKHLNGRDSLVILRRAMEGKRGNGVKREKEAKKRYEKFEEMKRERTERKLRVEETLDTLSVVFMLSVFACLFFIFC